MRDWKVKFGEGLIFDLVEPPTLERAQPIEPNSFQPLGSYIPTVRYDSTAEMLIYGFLPKDIYCTYFDKVLLKCGDMHVRLLNCQVTSITFHALEDVVTSQVQLTIRNVEFI